MTTNAHNPVDIYRCYPEKNPYDIRPPIYNLIPYQDADHVDTPQLKQAALDVANRTGINVLRFMYGQYPLLMAELDELEAVQNPVPFHNYRPPPDLPRTSLPDDVEFVRQLNEGGNTPVFVVRIGDVLRLLKMVRSSAHRHLTSLIDYACSIQRSISRKTSGKAIPSTRSGR